MTPFQDALVIVRLSIQRALLGEVSGQVRAVTLSMTGRNIDVKFYFDGAIAEVDYESASRVESEIMADFTADDTIIVECIRLDFPNPIYDDGVWVYLRREVI